MPQSPLEADDSAEVALLSNSAVDDDGAADEDDDIIVAQLLTADDRRRTRTERCCNKYCRYRVLTNRRIRAVLSGLMVFTGLFASMWSTFSCNLVSVEYPDGGLHLSITAVGIWKFEKEVTEQHPGSSQEATKKVCVGYDASQENQRADTGGFFPTDKTIQVYSILACSFYFAGMLSMLMYLLIPPSMRTGVVVGCVAFLVNAGIFHVLCLHGLSHPPDQSPICNAAYSHCHLGPGGRWAVYAVLSALLVSCIGTYHIGCSCKGSS